MRVVDAQVHIWSAGPPTTPTHRQIAVFTAEDLLKEMDEAGVDRALIVVESELGSDTEDDEATRDRAGSLSPGAEDTTPRNGGDEHGDVSP